jgi:hypothetical protein
MKDEQIPSTYPRHDVDPDLKSQDKWFCQYAKAGWKEDLEIPANKAAFRRAADKHREYETYYDGNQSIDKYKPMLDVDDEADDSEWKIDWTPRPTWKKYIDIAESKLLQREYNIIATPIDPLASDQMNEYFNEARVKILMRNALRQTNPELANSPQIAQMPGESETLEELERRMEFGVKHNMAMEAEQGISLVHYQNNLKEQRKEIIASLLKKGEAVYKDWTEGSKVKFRVCDTSAMVVSTCRKPDFSDARHIGEVIEVDKEELSLYFNDDQIKQIIEKQNKGNVKDDCKVLVLDLEVKSWDTFVRRQGENQEGNYIYKKSKYEHKDSNETVTIKGKKEPKYLAKDVENIYHGCWVIDTDLVYNVGKLKQKRTKTKELAATANFSYHIRKVKGLIERLIPTIDEYQMTVYKIQNFKNRWIPYIIDIDFDSLEDVMMGAGGEKWSPIEILDFLMKTNVLVTRRKDASGQNINYKSVDVQMTGMAGEFAELVKDLMRLVNEFRDISGMNEVTDGTSPNPKMLKMVAGALNDATNNALFPYMFCESKLMESLSKGCIQRLVRAVKDGEVSGTMLALGSGTVKFIKVSPDISLHAWGIMIEDRPDDDKIHTIIEQMNLGQAKDLLQPEDIFLIKNMTNVKQIEMEIAFRVKKRKEEKLQESLMLQEKNAQTQQQSTIVAEQAKQQTLQMEYQLKDMFDKNQKQREKELLAMKLTTELEKTDRNNETKENIAESKPAAQG